jgi:hypothetical protein
MHEPPLPKLLIILLRRLLLRIFFSVLLGAKIASGFLSFHFFETVSLGCPGTHNLLVSVSQVAGIASVSHRARPSSLYSYFNAEYFVDCIANLMFSYRLLLCQIDDQ